MAKPYKKSAESAEMTKALAMSGLKDDEIADLVGCAESTLKKYYAEELRFGRKGANARVVASLYKNALSGNVAAQIFWCKARLGWREVSEGLQANATPPPSPIYAELHRTDPTPPEFPNEDVH